MGTALQLASLLHISGLALATAISRPTAIAQSHSFAFSPTKKITQNAGLTKARLLAVDGGFTHRVSDEYDAASTVCVFEEPMAGGVPGEGHRRRGDGRVCQPGGTTAGERGRFCRPLRACRKLGPRGLALRAALLRRLL